MISELSNLLKRGHGEIETLYSKQEDSQNQLDSIKQLKECLWRKTQTREREWTNSTGWKHLNEEDVYFLMKNFSTRDQMI